MAKNSTPSAYGPLLTNVEKLAPRKGLARNRLTWEVEGHVYSANTYPGGVANCQAENHPEGVPATVIVNGNSQVLAVEIFSPGQDE